LGRGGEKHGPSLCPGQGEEGEGDEEGEKSGTTKKEKSAKGTKKTNGTAKKEEMLHKRVRSSILFAGEKIDNYS
jgi:hypothetical protein